MAIIILVEFMSLFYCFQVRQFERLCPVQLLVHNNLKTSETEPLPKLLEKAQKKTGIFASRGFLSMGKYKSWMVTKPKK